MMGSTGSCYGKNRMSWQTVMHMCASYMIGFHEPYVVYRPPQAEETKPARAGCRECNFEPCATFLLFCCQIRKAKTFWRTAAIP